MTRLKIHCGSNQNHINVIAIDFFKKITAAIVLFYVSDYRFYLDSFAVFFALIFCNVFIWFGA